MIEPDHSQLSVARQCALLGPARSTYYYRPLAVGADELALMEEIDRRFLETPWYGSRQMTAVLRRRGWHLNRKRTQRQMGLRARAPGDRTPAANSPSTRSIRTCCAIIRPSSPTTLGQPTSPTVPMPIGFCN